MEDEKPGNHFLKEDSCNNVSIARGIAGVLVILTGIIALVLILVLKIFKKYSQRLFLYLTLATLLHAPIYIMEVVSVDCNGNGNKLYPLARYPICSITGTLDMYTSWLQNIIVLWITLYLFRVIVLRKMINTWKLEVFVIVIALIAPLPAALVPLIDKKYGLNGAWCWIMTHKKNSTAYDYRALGYEIGFWYFPFLIETLIVILTVIGMVAVFIRRSFGKTKFEIYANEYKKQLKETLPLLIFPVVYCVLDIFEMLIDGTSSLESRVPEKHLYWMWMADAILNPVKAILVIGGYLICIIYSKHKEWRHKRYISLEKTVEETTIDSIRTNYGSTTEYSLSEEMLDRSRSRSSQL